ncbi:MAG: hypothetical protein RR415_08855 [Ruthenibacterium sp.]
MTDLEAEIADLNRLIDKQAYQIADLERKLATAKELVTNAGTLGLRSALTMIKNEVGK